MDRIAKICSYLDYSESFADVGCDHGYCTLHALKEGKCKFAYVTDISEKSLKKAQTLLSAYIKDGACRAVCCDGLSAVPEDIGQVLIAGMGGLEIIKIFSEGFIPAKFVLQPMNNLEKVRAFLLERGCKITADDIFYDKKYYFIIKGERSGGTSAYSQAELAFGRDSVRNPLFYGYARAELQKKSSYVRACKEPTDAVGIKREIELLKEITGL